jgi:hypothetical protein
MFLLTMALIAVMIFIQKQHAAMQRRIAARVQTDDQRPPRGK